MSVKKGQKINHPEIVQVWKERIFGIQKEFSGLPLQLDFTLQERPTESEIDQIVKVIVAQDKELYPEGDASPMTANEKYLWASRYYVGGREFSLGTLTSWVRLARGIKSGDIESLSTSNIIQEWKERIFGIQKEISGLPLSTNLQLSKKPTEAEIDEIVKAIVETDEELYPNGDPLSMNSGDKYFRKYYRIAHRNFTLSTLASWVRIARGVKSDDTEPLRDPKIIQEWQERIFGIKKDSSGLPLRLDLKLSKRPQEPEIDEIVKAIIEQDKDLYPDGDASRMSTNEKVLYRPYQIGDRRITLGTLAGWVRLARGMKSDDTDKIRDPEIIQEWQERIFGIRKEFTGLDLQLAFELSEKPTETEIGEIIKAIVAQDKNLYPDGDPSPISTSPNYFRDPHYRLGNQEISLRKLATWVRAARGLDPRARKNPSDPEIVQEWNEKIFGIYKEFSGLTLRLNLTLSERPIEAEINEIVKAIVAQDKEVYPNGDASQMTAGEKYLRLRYRIGDKEVHLGKLIDWVRIARGMRAKDSNILSALKVIQEWKEKLFGIIPARHPLDLVLSENPNETAIVLIVRTIVSQDQELYPNGDASRMSIRNKYFRNRWYRVGGKEVNLDTLASSM
jgi:hypothetical protein